MSKRKARRLQRHLEELGRYETDKALRKVRKEIKNGRQSKRNRRSDWQNEYLDNPEAFDEPQFERMAPRGRRQQREALQAEALARLAQEQADDGSPAPAGEAQGVVTQISSGLCRVVVGNERLTCTLRGSLVDGHGNGKQQLAVGDEVLVSVVGAGQGVVEAILPRRNQLARLDVDNRRRQQVVAANVDQLLIVASWRQPQFWPELVDRYLIAALRNNLKPVICLTKVDLADGPAEYQAVLRPYVDLEYRVLCTSTVTQTGIEALRQTLAQKRTVLAGLSGVGKSSLLAAIQPGLQVRIGAVNEERGQGRHTTTQATWHALAGGGAVIDTPGIREFGLAGLAPEELVGFYPEIVAVAQRCRFANCTHLHEPDCAVQAAVAAGQISAARYHGYKKIYESLG